MHLALKVIRHLVICDGRATYQGQQEYQGTVLAVDRVEAIENVVDCVEMGTGSESYDTCPWCGLPASDEAF